MELHLNPPWDYALTNSVTNATLYVIIVSLFLVILMIALHKLFSWKVGVYSYVADNPASTSSSLELAEEEERPSVPLSAKGQKFALAMIYVILFCVLVALTTGIAIRLTANMVQNAYIAEQIEAAYCVDGKPLTNAEAMNIVRAAKGETVQQGSSTSSVMVDAFAYPAFLARADQFDVADSAASGGDYYFRLVKSQDAYNSDVVTFELYESVLVDGASEKAYKMISPKASDTSGDSVIIAYDAARETPPAKQTK